MSFHGGSPCNARSVAQSLGRMALLFRPPGPRHQDSPRPLMKPGVGLEKLLPTKFAKIKLLQEALQSISLGRLDIFYPPNFGCLGRKASFSTATPVLNSYAPTRLVHALAETVIERNLRRGTVTHVLTATCV